MRGQRGLRAPREPVPPQGPGWIWRARAQRLPRAPMFHGELAGSWARRPGQPWRTGWASCAVFVLSRPGRVSGLRRKRSKAGADASRWSPGCSRRHAARMSPTQIAPRSARRRVRPHRASQSALVPNLPPGPPLGRIRGGGIRFGTRDPQSGRLRCPCVTTGHAVGSVSFVGEKATREAST